MASGPAAARANGATALPTTTAAAGGDGEIVASVLHERALPALSAAAAGSVTVAAVAALAGRPRVVAADTTDLDREGVTGVGVVADAEGVEVSDDGRARVG